MRRYDRRDMDPKKKNEDTYYDINEDYHEEMLKAKHGTCTSS